MRLRRSVGTVGAAVAVAVAVAACGSGGGTSPGGTGSSATPASLTVWRMGPSVSSQVTWMNDIVNQFHKRYPQYKNTTIKVVWIPWANATTDFQNAFTSGKNPPDVTEIGNTETPDLASQGFLADITNDVNGWSARSDIVPGMLANDTINGTVYGVPWFGGVRGIWYRKSEFAALHLSPPQNWSQLVSDAQALMKKYPGSYGLGAPSNYTNAIVSFIWGAGGQVAVKQNGKWVAELTSPQSEAGIRFYADLYLKYHVSPAKYIGQTELGNGAATSGGSNEDFALGKLDMYIDGPWAEANFPNTRYVSDMASFPIPGRSGGMSPAFAGGSDLAVWAASRYKQADWDLIQVMDSKSNSTSFANLQGFFPPYSSVLTGGAYAGSPVLAGFAKAATKTQISPLNAKNWATADIGGDEIIPTMMKSLDNGANFTATVAKANTELQNVLNTGKES